MVIDAEFARRVFGGRDPLGAQVHVGGEDQPPYTVIGVAGDVKQASLGAEQADAFYVSPDQWDFTDGALWLVVRAQADPAALVPAIKRAGGVVGGPRPADRAGVEPRGPRGALGVATPLRDVGPRGVRGAGPHSRGDRPLRRALRQRRLQAARDRRACGARGQPAASRGDG